jgi:hypothetical protein
MLCKVRFTTADPKEDFGKYAMFVTECETGYEWQEIRFEDESMLASVINSIGATEEQKAILYKDLAKHSETIMGEFEIDDDRALLLRE